MVKSLYILGNGFDIHHGINSKYSDYHEWLEKNDNGTYEKLCAIYDTCAYKWWNNFEQSLSKVSFDYISITSSENTPVYGSDGFSDADNHRAAFQVELDMENLLNLVKLSLEKWVNGLNRANKGKLRLADKENSFFITFNYTRTLEEVYNIPKAQICHIHGCISEGDLIVGHNKTSEEIYKVLKGKEKLPPKGLTDAELEEWMECFTDDLTTQDVIDASSAYAGRMKKNVRGIIAQHQKLFETFKDVEKIYVLGFSFSPIDVPYIEEILKYIDKEKVIWVVSSYSYSDNVAIGDFINRNSLDNRLWRIIKLETLDECKELMLDLKC